MINKKLIDINNNYYVKITYHDGDDVRRLYMLIDKKTDATICESFNRDAFLLKANKYVKINNKIECLIASI